VEQRTDQEEMMFRYLLGAGELPAREAERFEDEYFGDDETFALLLAAEDELIDRYLRGDLDAADRERFEKHFLLSPRRRQKVENARAISRVIPELATLKQARHEPTSAPRSFFSSPSWLKPLPAVSFAMAALLLAVGVTSVYKIRQSSRELDQARRERAALESQIAGARKESDLLSQRLQRANDQLANFTGEQSASSTIISGFVLNLDSRTAGRAEGETMKLTIPSKSKVARLQLVMAPTSDYGNYQAALKQVGSEVALWSQRRLRASRTTTGEATIDLWLPASLLAQGDYILELTGITLRGQPERLPPYTFSVER